MSQKILSVIVPVYNVQDFVERCIRSLERQDISQEQYELIVINDGSPDDSLSVIKGLQSEFSNILLIDQQNTGVSVARNNGLQQATGEYVLFVDPDDYVDENSFARVLKAATSANADMTFLGYTVLSENETVEHDIFYEQYAGKVFSGIQAYPISRGDGKVDPDRSVGILFRRAFIEKHAIRYLQGVPYLEDGDVMARASCLAERCVFEGKSFYRRTTRPGSATHSNLFFSDRASEGFIKVALGLLHFQKNPLLSDAQKLFLNQPICKFVLLALIPHCSFRRWSQFRYWCKQLASKGLVYCNVTGCNKNYRIEGRLYNISPYLFFLHRWMRLPLFRITSA